MEILPSTLFRELAFLFMPLLNGSPNVEHDPKAVPRRIRSTQRSLTTLLDARIIKKKKKKKSCFSLASAPL